MASISNSRLGTLCFIGVVKIFAANFVTNFVEIKAQIFADIIIILGIFNDLVGLIAFFAISIKLILGKDFACFFAKFKKHKSSI
ncbi:hypothetical protein [uncultured Flavobacterium sp.]|uniref:hypothetical protein n=1 Tax=uncultured Flavobacterium sp. TaxID=165435 RepID=UPI002596C0F8|nr:hypothetical protein [uncultured Flavobacterium sp.]